MDSLFAAAPFEEFVRERSPGFAIVILVLLGVLGLRLLVKTMTRIMVLGSLVLLAAFFFIERDNIAECTRTCECSLAGFDTTLPYCNPV